MTPTELLLELTNVGVHVIRNGDALEVEAPKGALTPPLRAGLVEHKFALLALLAAEAKAWGREQARQVVAQAIADVDAEQGGDGYDRHEFTRFNHALSAAFEAQSISAVRSACVVFRNAARLRASSARHPAHDNRSSPAPMTEAA